MARQRLVKPEFFQHEGLYRAEASSGLPLRIAFEGLWCQADMRGCFEWKPSSLKLNVLPFDDVDFAAVLTALEQASFVTSYEVDGRRYGYIPTFEAHQSFHVNEKPNPLIPAPPRDLRTRKPPRRKTRARPPRHRAGTVQAPDLHRVSTPVTGTVTVTDIKTTTTTASGRERTDGETALLAAAPEEVQHRLAAVFDGWVQGMGYGDGKRACDPADLHVGCLEYMAGRASPSFAPREIQKWVLDAERRRTAPPGAIPNGRNGGSYLESEIARLKGA